MYLVERLIGLAKKPQRPGSKAAHGNSWVLRIEKGIIAMQPGVVEYEGFLKVFNSRCEFAQMHERDLHRPMSSHRDWRARQAFSQAQEFLGDLAGSTKLRPQYIKCPEAP